MLKFLAVPLSTKTSKAITNWFSVVTQFNKFSILALFLCVGCYSFYAQNSLYSANNVVNVTTSITAVSAAELEISSEKVSKTVTWTLNFLSPTDLEQRKHNLIQEVCKENGADVLVDPQFTYSKRLLGGGKLTVTGYPAKYKNFRSLTDTEVDSFILHPNYSGNRVVFINR